MSKVFIVGKNKPGKDCWEFQGVFSTEENAIKACEGHQDYFIGPAVMDEVICEIDKPNQGKTPNKGCEI